MVNSSVDATIVVWNGSFRSFAQANNPKPPAPGGAPEIPRPKASPLGLSTRLRAKKRKALAGKGLPSSEQSVI